MTFELTLVSIGIKYNFMTNRESLEFVTKIYISLPNFAFFNVKSPSVTQRSVSQENAFKRSKNPSPFPPQNWYNFQHINNFIF